MSDVWKMGTLTRKFNTIAYFDGLAVVKLFGCDVSPARVVEVLEIGHRAVFAGIGLVLTGDNGVLFDFYSSVVVYLAVFISSLTKT